LIDRWLKFNQSLFPQACMLCSAPQGGSLALCAGCLQDLPWHSAGRCPQCALASVDNQVCGHCLKSPPAFDYTQALFRYEYPLDAMLQRYKYNHLLALAETFGALLADSIAPISRSTSHPDIIIPMPLHPQRLAERGFNQAVEIARVVSRQLNIKMDTTSCGRIKLAPPQVSLPLKQRVKNMRGAFACNQRLDGLHITLIDDVMTTGASLNALAKTIKSAGADSVECWVVARTLPH